MGEILPISRFSRKFINTYGSRESRFPYIGTKGFLRRYSQSVESIFFFRLRCSLISMNMYHDLLEKSGGGSRNFL